MIKDEKWPVARLIPISSASGVEAQERRLASALLAVMGAVPEFGLSLLKPLGAPSGRIETFIEVPFKLGEGRTIRPDGVIVVTRAGKSWSALVEAKVASSRLDTAQMNAYLDLAKETEFEAVISISNQYVSSSTDYPIEIDRRKLRRTRLHHWSWIDLLTIATVQQDYRGIQDPDQAYILGELIRYLSDPRSGAVAFDGMGSSWTSVRDGARVQTLRKTDPDVVAIAAKWDDLVRYVGLMLTTALGREVRQVLTPAERTPSARRQALVDSLVAAGRLYADLQVPDVAGPLSIAADLRSRQVIASTSIEAPKEGTSKGRVSWLLRQLQTAPEDLKVEARVAWRSASLAAPLSAVRAEPALLHPEKGREIRGFVLSTTSNMGGKRDSGRGSFSESVVSASENFYEQVLQRLRAWKAAPPQLKKGSEKDEFEEVVAELVGVEPTQIAELDQPPAATKSESTAEPTD
ncbi:MAG: hypothetical protein M3P26_15385 [Gemmatimonadota bacterium]|nr:hypothetical protein [Gemmatimonadota bacterium]